MGLGNDGNSDPAGQHCGLRHDDDRGQTLLHEGRKDNQTYCKSCKTNVDNQSLRATTVSERVKLLKESMNAMHISMKEGSTAFERKVDAILTKVEENERMLQMKYPWLQDMSNTNVPSVQSIHYVITNPTRCPADLHLKAINDINSSLMRVPINPHFIPIKYINSNPKACPIGAHLNPRSSSSYDMNSSSPLSHLHFPHTMSGTTKVHISSSHKSSPCTKHLTVTRVESPYNKCEDQEYFLRYPTKVGTVYLTSRTSCIKCNQPITQDSSPQQNPHMYVNSSSIGVACECEYNVNKQLFSIEDFDNSDLQFLKIHHDHSESTNPSEAVSVSMLNNVIHGYGENIPDLEYSPYPTSLSRPIMSPHQSCMGSLSPKYVLCIPMKREKGFGIPNVSNKNDRYHSIHQYCHYDATPALDRLYDRGRSYNKGQSYDRGWNCIPDMFCIP